MSNKTMEYWRDRALAAEKQRDIKTEEFLQDGASLMIAGALLAVEMDRHMRSEKFPLPVLVDGKIELEYADDNGGKAHNVIRAL